MGQEKEVVVRLNREVDVGKEKEVVVVLLNREVDVGQEKKMVVLLNREVVFREM